ncbi:hypothetical protein, partial [Novosphingobium beihaiensis]|nr:hypothetical protein [Novosphingobium beihaiensis]
MKTATWISTAAFAILLAAPANAQIGPALDPGLMVGYTGAAAVHYDNARRSSASKPPPSTRSLRLSATSSDAALPSAASLSYRPRATVRKQNFAQFVAQTRAVDPDGAEKLQHLLTSVDVMNEVQKQLG